MRLPILLAAAVGALFATLTSSPAGAGERPFSYGQRTVEDIAERIALKDCAGIPADAVLESEYVFQLQYE